MADHLDLELAPEDQQRSETAVQPRVTCRHLTSELRWNTFILYLPIEVVPSLFSAITAGLLSGVIVFSGVVGGHPCFLVAVPAAGGEWAGAWLGAGGCRCRSGTRRRS